MSSEIAVQATLTGPLGVLVLDGDNADEYELHPDTKAEYEVTWREQTTENEWVEGSFTTSAVRTNVTETLAVWVLGDTTSEIEQRQAALTAFLKQRRFTVALALAGVTHTWTVVKPAQYSVRQQHEFLHAPTSLVIAKLSRLPKATIAGTFGSVDT
jgi:hypothetical protein